MRTRWNWAAAIAIAATGVACGSNSSTTSDSAPTATEPTLVSTSTTLTPSPTTDTTMSPPPTSDVPSSIDTTTTAPNAELSAWVDEQVRAGRTEASVTKGIGTGALLVAAHAPGSFADTEARIILTDGFLVAVPGDLPRDRYPTLVGIGERVALLAPVGSAVALWLLDEKAHTWAAGPELGITLPANSQMGTEVLGGFALVTSEHAVDRGDGISIPADQQGALVSPSLDVIPMASTPAGLFMTFTTILGSRAFVLGLDNGAQGHEPLTQPWEFDAATNTWTPVPIPTWLTCAPACEWSAPHEFADAHFESGTDRGIVMRLPDGSVGLYEPDSRQWRQLDMPPFQLATPATAALDGGLVVVAPQRAYGADWDLGTVGVLDLATGTWTTHTLANPPLADAIVVWEANTNGRVALLRLRDRSIDSPDDEPDLTFDATSRSWRTPTAEDITLWHSLETVTEVDIRTLGS